LDLFFLLEGDAKNAHLLALDGAAERLRLFKADLLDYGSMAAAVAGCDVVFHVACPVLAASTPNPEVSLALFQQIPIVDSDVSTSKSVCCAG
jgi:nucleoside-diphosphate-sugar epimerase